MNLGADCRFIPLLGTTLLILSATYSINDLQILTVKEGISRFSSHYNVRIRVHPKELIASLTEPPIQRRLCRYWPHDLLVRFYQPVLIVFLVCKLQFVSFYSPLSPPVSEPLINRGVLLSTLLQDILHPSHHLLNVLLQIANKLGLSNQKKNYGVTCWLKAGSGARRKDRC
jgi:hypothetical protein